MSKESVEVHRWPGDRTPVESTRRRIMAGEGLQPCRWSNAPGDRYAAHTHAYHKVLGGAAGDAQCRRSPGGTAQKRVNQKE